MRSKELESRQTSGGRLDGQKDGPVRRVRGIPPETVRLLAVRAGGRCEFRGCNAYLFEHGITKQTGNFAEQAHIVAFSADGPRGQTDERPDDIHDVENLMFLCPPCHKAIDDDPDEFPLARLSGFKAEHEIRIRRATGLAPDAEVIVCVLKAPIAGAHIDIPRDHILEAINPMWPAESKFIEIDLSDLDGQRESAGFLEVGRAKIDREIDRLFAAKGAVSRVPRIAAFALAPIPLLIHFGARLENKIPVQLFQRHRDTQDWRWKPEAPSTAFEIRRFREMPEGAPIALVLSLSGTVKMEDLPTDVREGFQIYEIALTSADPNPTFLRTTADLQRFGAVYQDFLGRLAAERGYVAEISVFPAVPAPVAVMIGKERLMKRHPALQIFDYDRSKGGFTFQMKVD
ncbi:MAG: HNH endonuclease [Micropepsaceae bacterium]